MPLCCYTWNLFARAGSLWVEEVWLKGKSLWQIPILQTCSWSWSKILKLRRIARSLLNFYSMIIGTMLDAL